jgi:hypothetical protein
MDSPDIQDRIFDHVFGGYIRDHGSPQDAASMWFTGHPVRAGDKVSDILGTTASQYVQKFNDALARHGGDRGGVTPAGGEIDLADITPEALQKRLEDVSGVTTLTPLTKKLSTAIATDNHPVVAKELVKWGKENDAFEAAKADGSLSEQETKVKQARLTRRQAVILAARDTVTQLNQQRAEAAAAAATAPVTPTPGPAPEMALAQAGEEIAAGGVAGRQVADQLQTQGHVPAPLDEATREAMDKTREKALQQIINNPIVPDPEAAFQGLLASTKDAKPMTAVEKHALDTAKHIRILDMAKEQQEAQAKADEKAATAAQAKPTEAAKPAAAAEPTAVAEPTAEQAFADETKAHAATHLAAIGSKPVVSHWFNQGVKAALGEEHITPDTTKTTGRLNNKPNFDKGVAFVEARRTETAAPAAPKAEPKVEPKVATKPSKLTKATQEATTAKATRDQEKADKAAAAAARTENQRKARERAAVKAAEDRAAAQAKAAKRRAEAAAEKRAAAAKVKADAKAAADKAKAEAKAAKAPAKPKATPTARTQRAINAKKPPVAAPVLTEEQAAEAKFKADLKEFEAKTQKAADDDQLSGFQRQNLDILADKTGNIELAETAMAAEKARYEKGHKDPEIGKGETLADLLQRGKEAPLAVQEQTPENVVEPATPAPRVKIAEGPPVTSTVQTMLADKLLPHEQRTLAKVYGEKTYNRTVLSKFTQDFVNYANGVLKGIDAAVIRIAKRIQAAVLAVTIVFNPAGLHPVTFTTSPATTVERMVDIKTQVPAEARAKMSDKAIAVYEAKAATAMARGKGFFIADKPNGVIHVFDKDGKYVATSAALYGAMAGDTFTEWQRTANVDELGPNDKITPAGTYRVNWKNDAEYRGGGAFYLTDAKTGEFQGGVAIHAVYTGTPSEHRTARLATATAADNKVSFGCINTSNEVFLKDVAPHKADFENGLVFVLPDVVANTEAMFPTEKAKVAETVPGKSTPAPAQEPSTPTLPAEERTTAQMQARRREGRGAPPRLSQLSNAATKLAEITQVTPEQAQALDARLRAALDRRGLHDVKLETSTLSSLEGAEGEFRATRLTRIIKVAMDAANTDLTLDHEMVHALADMGVIRPGDYDKLVKAAWESPEIEAYVKTHYPNLARPGQNSEAVAEFVARVINDPGSITLNGEIDGIITRIKQFFASVWQAFRGQDYKTANDVINAINSGEIGGKARTARPGSTLLKFSRTKTGRGSESLSRMADLGKSAEAHARRNTVEKGAAGLNASARVAGRKGHIYFTPTEDMANVMASHGVKAGRRVVDEHSNNHALGRKYEERVIATKEKIGRLAAKYQGVGPGSVSRLVHDSTISDKWAFVPTEKLGFPKGWDTKAVVDPNLAAQFNAMPVEAQEAIQEMFKYNVDTNDVLRKDVEEQIAETFKSEMAKAKTDAERADIAKRQQRAVEFTSRAFDTQEALPYAPLKRSGWYVVSAKSDAFKAAEESGDKAAIDKMVSDDNHNFVRFADTVWEAEALASNVADKFGSENVDYYERSKIPENAIHPETVFVTLDKLRASVANSTTKGSQMAGRMERLVNDLHLHMLAETSARKSELGRDKVPSTDPLTGEAVDMVKAFVSRGMATANLIASVHNGGAVAKAITDMHAEVGKLHGAARTDAQIMVNELMFRYTANNNVKPSRAIDRVVRGISAYTLLSSPFYYIQNFTQAALISLPKLASQYGYFAAWGHFMTGYKEFLSMTKGIPLTERMDFSNTSGKYKDLMEHLANRGRLDAGFASEAGRWEVNGDGLIPTASRLADRFFRQMPQRIEVANRVATGVAAYEAALSKGKSKEVAIEEASKLIYDTHGDYSGFNAPTPFHQLGNAGKVMLQFRKFQFIMGALVAKEVHRTFFKSGATREERAAGAKGLVFLTAHMAAIGGALAIPGANILGPVIGALMNLLDKDDDKDWNDWQEDMRDALGAGGEGAKRNFWADFLYKGAPYALLNMDLSDRLGMGNIYALAPYADINESSTKEKIQAELFKAMMGPSGNLLNKAIDGWGFGVEKHDWYRMIETMAPTGPANVLKAHRLATGGLTAANGDVLMKPELNQGMNEFYTALGVRPRNLVNEGQRRSVLFEKGEFYDNKTTQLKQQYIEATKSRDPAKIAAARQEWMAIQDARVRDGLMRQPLATLMKAPFAQTKRERSVIGGAETTRANRTAALQMLFAQSPDEARQLMEEAA